MMAAFMRAHPLCHGRAPDQVRGRLVPAIHVLFSGDTNQVPPPRPHHIMQQTKSEIRDGMQIDWDAPIAMDDGVVLRADVFRPVAEGRYPVILSYGPYAKGLAFQEGYKSAWLRVTRDYPESAQGPSNK